MFGQRLDGKWVELIDGDLHPTPTFEPIEWAVVPDEKIADWAMG